MVCTSGNQRNTGENWSLLPPCGSWGWNVKSSGLGGNAVTYEPSHCLPLEPLEQRKIMWPELSVRKQEHTGCCVESKDTSDKPLMNPSKRWQAPGSAWQCFEINLKKSADSGHILKTWPSSRYHRRPSKQKKLSHPVTGILVQIVRKWMQTFKLESYFFLLPLYMNA